MADHGFSERRACRLIGVNRSAWQYEPLRGKDDAVRERMREIANERRRFGYRRLAVLLRREGKGMNLKKVYRLYREERLTVRKRGGRKRALGTRAPIAIPQEPNQRWSLDFVSDSLACGRRIRVLNVIDESQPGVPGLHRRHLAVRPACCAGADRHRRASRAAVHGGQRQRNRADQSRRPRLVPGHRRRVALHRAGKGSPELVEGPQQNGFVESFNGRLRDECLNEHLFPSLAVARPIIEAWRTDYNTVRPHSSLGEMAPAEFTNRPCQGHMDTEAKLPAA